MPEFISPYWTTTDKLMVRLYHGDAIKILRKLSSESVQCIVTSPPYWGLRDYQTGTWIGGDQNCDHLPTDEWLFSHSNANSSLGDNTTQKAAAVNRWYKADGSCRRCSANRIDKQIGSEKTPDEFVAKMVEIFREIRRVLRDDGTVWLNLGDSYASGVGETGRNDSDLDIGRHSLGRQADLRADRRNDQKSRLKPGNLVGIPWRVALALQADGWILRQDIIWSKPSPMPESVKNRCTKAHEYIFLFTKSMCYYYDAEAIKKRNDGNEFGH